MPMKLPRLRVRTMMVLVAVAAIGVAGWILKKRSDFYTLAATNLEQMIKTEERSVIGVPRKRNGVLVSEAERLEIYQRGRRHKDAVIAWARPLAARFRRAARYPWLQLGPVPPMPMPQPLSSDRRKLE